MSNSVRPHRRQPTRLPRPWDSPGKNTGVGRHFLLQCMKVKIESEGTQSCPTLRDPMDCSLPGFSIHGIFQARVLEWGGVGCHRLLCPWSILCINIRHFVCYCHLRLARTFQVWFSRPHSTDKEAWTWGAAVSCLAHPISNV